MFVVGKKLIYHGNIRYLFHGKYYIEKRVIYSNSVWRITWWKFKPWKSFCWTHETTQTIFGNNQVLI